MTTLASRPPYQPPIHSNAAMPPNGGHYRAATATAVNFTSPTESEFSESYKDTRDSVQEWDETRVAEWLKSINFGQYVDIFRKNNINGENLIDIDQATLKEMGIKRIGDRVRIGAQAKVFRGSVSKRTSKRSINRVSPACFWMGKTGLTRCSTLWRLSTATPLSRLRLRDLHDPCMQQGWAVARLARRRGCRARSMAMI